MNACVKSERVLLVVGRAAASYSTSLGTLNTALVPAHLYDMLHQHGLVILKLACSFGFLSIDIESANQISSGRGKVRIVARV